MVLCQQLLAIFAAAFILLSAATGEATFTPVEALKQELDRIDSKIDSLTSSVVTLFKGLDNIQKENDQDGITIKYLVRLLDNFEDKRGPCEKGFFPCSSGPYGGVQCIRDYLVCDRYKDCKNGADESEDLCNSLSFTKPTSMLGYMTKDTCSSATVDSFLHRALNWTVKATIIPWFPSRPKLTWTFQFSMYPFGKAVTSSSGVYDYSTGNILVRYDYLAVGICEQRDVSPGRARFFCELTRGNDMTNKCFVATAVLNKPV